MEADPVHHATASAASRSHPSVGVVGIPFTIDFAIIYSNPWQPPASRVNMHEGLYEQPDDQVTAHKQTSAGGDF
ncbi:unnamed protein product [Urochloa humidicola]